jgi:hypothetical protein
MKLTSQDEIEILMALDLEDSEDTRSKIPFYTFIDKGDYIELDVFDGEKMYNIFPNYEAAKEAAKESMQNLFDDMGIEGWRPEFVRNYYRIREGDIRFLVDDMVEAEREAIEDELQSAVENDPTGEGMNIEDEVEDRLEDMRRDYERKLSDDPKDFLVEELGYYSEEDFFKQSFVDYDLDRLFEDSIDTDGLAHTLASYDNEEIVSGDYHIYRWN